MTRAEICGRGAAPWRQMAVASALFGLLVAGPGPADPPNLPDPPPPSSQPAAAPRMSTGQAQGTFVNFSFDQVEIRLLVKLVGDLTGRRFVIDKGVEGRVTVVTPPQIPISEVYPLFLAILDASGCAVVERDGVLRVVSREPRAMPLAPLAGTSDGQQGLVTKVIKVEHLNVAELRQAFEPLVAGGKSGGIGVLEATGHLIVTDTPTGINRIEQILAQIDRPGMTQAIELVPLTHADARTLAGELNQAVSSMDTQSISQGERIRQRLTGSRGGELPAIIVAAPHSNHLLVAGTPVQVANLKRLIAGLDVEPHRGQGRLRVMFLKYLTAEDAAKSLSALLAKRGEKQSAQGSQSIAIEPSTANNALLVDAEPQDFEMVRGLLEELDKPPPQVLVEVLIAEVSMSDGEELGIEFLGAGPPEAGRTVAIGGSKTVSGDDSLMADVIQGIVPNGLTFGLMRGTYTDAQGRTVPGIPFLMNVNAIRQKSNMKILSSIPLWTQNNQEASVSVVKNIPILKSTIQGGSGTARDVIENIDRIDVGIKLSVTPHVNPDREVLMKLKPSIEAVVENSSADHPLTPTIARREVTTTVTVADGRTIVISGLIREDTVKQTRRMPLFGSIPLIGLLFRSKVDVVERTNLLIFVTPYVVSDEAQAEQIRSQLQSRTGIEPAKAGPGAAKPDPEE